MNSVSANKIITKNIVASDDTSNISFLNYSLTLHYVELNKSTSARSYKYQTISGGCLKLGKHLQLFSPVIYTSTSSSIKRYGYMYVVNIQLINPITKESKSYELKSLVGNIIDATYNYPLAINAAFGINKNDFESIAKFNNMIPSLVSSAVSPTMVIVETHKDSWYLGNTSYPSSFNINDYDNGNGRIIFTNGELV